MKKSVFTMVLVLCVTLLQAQTKNIFLERDFWKTNPTVKQVEQKIKEGNSATQLNRFNFDAVVYALLENADESVLKYLLSQKGNEVNKLTHDGRTYIFWAAYKNNLPIVKYLLVNGANMDVIDDKGYSILNFTAVAGVENPELYDFLIANGADVLKDKIPKGANALLLIIPKLKNFKMVDYFTNKGLSINSVDNDGNGAFNYTAQSGNKTMLELLIKKGLPYKTLNKKGGNAMLFATRGSRRGYNSLDFFKYLENQGIKPNITNKEGKTPLHNIAYRNKNITAFNYFIAKGVDVNQVDNNGNTPLLNAARRNSLEVIQLLASKTKNINHTNKDGKSALTLALKNKPEVIDFLLKKGAKILVIDSKGNDLSYHLFKTFDSKNTKDFQKKLTALNAKGLVVGKPQKSGNTLYHLAVEKQDVSLLNFIKQYPININAKNKKGLAPLQQAVMTAKDDVIIKYLITEGADKTVKTDFDETVYDLAKENEALKNTDISFLK